MRSGLALSLLTDKAKENLAAYKSSGHLEIVDEAFQLTAQGRLIADRLVREALA
jgi:oxygen-independent coproporphyrinogen-3 oxidase